ncbi:hypothetical protein VKT23_019929 [Stygiomarasmius scandens]|uniref:Uncharacterized protein n=1 Tax=Marasmiellus scandens TaxID=2682957 RepID=A0ABR1IK46_9AGAR
MALYSTLPEQRYTFSEYVLKAHELNKQQNPDFFDLLLSGEVPGERHQVVIDATANYLADDYPIGVSRDYDSVIGICRSIMVKDDLSLYPVSGFYDYLKKSVHLMWGIPSVDRQTEIHRIPNFQLGFWGARHMLYIFFPNADSRPDDSEPDDSEPDDSKAANGLSVEQMRQFYDKGLRPTIAELTPLALSDWPVNYNAEIFRGTPRNRRKGAFIPQTKIFPKREVPKFAQVLRERLRVSHQDWANGFFFMLDIRGIKHATQHNLNGDSAKIALDAFLERSHIDISSGQWWIDVGMEFVSQKKECLQWISATHARIVEDVLGISEAHAVRITSLGSRAYSRDLSSLLTDVAGCRIEPGSRAKGPFEAAYLQMYTTDKSAIYAPEGYSYGKVLTMSKAMGEVPNQYLRGLTKLYADCSHSITSHARLEVRVPMQHATSVLRTLDRGAILSSLVAFPTLDWWYFRFYRALAIRRILERQAKSTSALRVSKDALLLTAVCVWLVNGLHSRPDDGAGCRSLLLAALPTTDEDRSHIHPSTLLFPASGTPSDNGVTSPVVPIASRGAVFTRCIQVTGSVPQMCSGGPFLNDTAFLYFFGRPIESIRATYYRPRAHSEKTVRKGVTERRNMVHLTRVHPVIQSQPQRTPSNPSSRNSALPPNPIENQLDAQDSSHMEIGDQQDGSNVDQENRDLDHDRMEFAKNLWTQMLLDIVSKIPNQGKSSASPYAKISAEEHLNVTEKLFKRKDLSEIFHAYRFKFADDRAYLAAFDHLVCVPEAKPDEKKKPHYRNCTYWRRWIDYIETHDISEAKDVRDTLQVWFIGLWWIPHVGADKIWQTSPTGVGAGFTRMPQGTLGAAPRILCRGVPE